MSKIDHGSVYRDRWQLGVEGMRLTFDESAKQRVPDDPPVWTQVWINPIDYVGAEPPTTEDWLPISIEGEYGAKEPDEYAHNLSFWVRRKDLLAFAESLVALIRINTEADE